MLALPISMIDIRLYAADRWITLPFNETWDSASWTQIENLVLIEVSDWTCHMWGDAPIVIISLWAHHIVSCFISIFSPQKPPPSCLSVGCENINDSWENIEQLQKADDLKQIQGCKKETLSFLKRFLGEISISGLFMSMIDSPSFDIPIDTCTTPSCQK